MTYYSIYIPSKTDIELKGEDHPRVFTKREEALDVLKNFNHKDARLMSFQTNEDAIKFSEIGCPIKTSGLKSPSAAGSLEKAAFRAPTKQDLIQFRKTIEEDKYDSVQKTIWENPRYLINSGDTPTSLKDGTRYNALHVCALHKRARIADLILQTISNIDFIELMHGNKNAKICREVSDILLDYYLNMPEKGRSETPLHLAVKYGAVEIVEVLTTYPQCKMTPNLEKMLPKDLICSRMDNPPKELKEKIAMLLEERFYVPVIRSVDNSMPPTIGEPFSPSKPPELNKDPLSPELEIQAYAGPMNKEQAMTFRRRWKTPPRVSTPSPLSISNSSFKSNSSFISPSKILSSTPAKTLNNNSTPRNISKETPNPVRTLNFNLVDSENGNCPEKIEFSEHENNNSFHVPQTLSSFTPLRRNPKKRDLFFTYRDRIGSPLLLNDDSNASTNSEINNSTMNACPSHRERHVKLTDTDKGLELVGRELAHEQNIEWKEYWDFLGGFVDIASHDGLTQLEEFLKSRADKQEHTKEKVVNKEEQLMSNLCKALDNLELFKEPTVIYSNHIANKNGSAISNDNQKILSSSHQTTSPYLCVEKSIQVFANRMCKTIIHSCESVISITESFNSELKRLRSLVCSFKDDQRFRDIIDFSLVHSRFVNLVIIFIRNHEDFNDQLREQIQKCFEQLLQTKVKVINPEHFQCVTKLFLKNFKNEDNKILPENMKTEKICQDTWRAEEKCDCFWDYEIYKPTLRNLKRNKRLELAELSKKNYDIVENSNENPIKALDRNGLNSWRFKQESTYSSTEEESTGDDDDDEEDVFWSDIGSEDGEVEEHYYTPPESPSILEMDISDDLFKDYNIYLLGDEPTKRDLDVLNALFNTEIDRETFPHIHRWRAAVLRHPNEDRDNFPSPSVIVKKRVDSYSSDDRSKIMRRLFLSPKRAATPLSPGPRAFEGRGFQRLLSSSSNSPLKSSPTTTNSSAKSLLFMNVSDL